MLAFIVLPFYIFLNLYVLRRMLCWLKSCLPMFGTKCVKAVISAVYLVCAFSLVIAFFLPQSSQARRDVQLFANYWLGVFLYTLLTIAVGHLISLLLRHVFRIVPKDFFKKRQVHVICGIVTFAVIAGVSGYGIYHATDIKTNSYSVSVNKDAAGEDKLKVVLVADLHLGYSIGTKQMEKMTDLINRQEPDIVCIAGDIYDNNYDAIENPDRIAEVLSGIKSTYGTYACWGNHDVNEKILGGFTFDIHGEKVHDERMTEFLRKSHITMLEDEAVLIDNRFYVCGRIDGEKPATYNNTRKTPEELLDGTDKTKPIIVIYHEPDELQELADVGCDLLLCGHTHNGQVFPGNLTIKLAWENAVGYLKKDDMHNIVTSGVGVWGPFMRVGTDAEVVGIDVTFAGN